MSISIIDQVLDQTTPVGSLIFKDEYRNDKLVSDLLSRKTQITSPFVAAKVGWFIAKVAYIRESKILVTSVAVRDMLVEALKRHVTSPESVRQVCLAIGNIATTLEGKGLFSTPEFASAILEALNKYANTAGSVEEVGYAIGNITGGNPEGQRLFSTRERASAIVAALKKYATTPSSVQYVGFAIGNITFSNPEGQRVFSTPECAIAIVEALKKIGAASPESLKNVLDSIRNIAQIAATNTEGKQFVDDFVTAVSTALNNAESKVSSLEQEKKNLDKEKKTLQETFNNTNAALATEKGKNTVLQREVSSSTVALNDEKNKNTLLEDDKTKLQAELDDAVATLSSEEKKNSSLAKENNEQQQQLREAEAKIRSLERVRDEHFRSQNFATMRPIENCPETMFEMRFAQLNMEYFQRRRTILDAESLVFARNAHFFRLHRQFLVDWESRIKFFNESCVAALELHHETSRTCHEAQVRRDEQTAFNNAMNVFTLQVEQQLSFETIIKEEVAEHRLIDAQAHCEQHELLIAEEALACSELVSNFSLEVEQQLSFEKIIKEEIAEHRLIDAQSHLEQHELFIAEEAAAFVALVADFSLVSAELKKFEWFRFLCFKTETTFTVQNPMSKVIETLEAGEILNEKDFKSVSRDTLREDCKFPALIVDKLCKLIETTASTPSISHPTQKLLEEVKSKLSGVHVFPPTEVELKRSKTMRLGKGGYGTVYSAKIISQRNRPCAAKVFYNKDLAIQEAKNLYFLDHPNVVRLLGVTVHDSSEPSVVLLLELADSDFSRIINSKLSSRQVRRFVEQIARGLEYLHRLDPTNGKLRVIHLDLKPANILVFRNGTQITLKISDLGFVHETEVSSTSQRTSFAATERYLSPETRIDRRKSRKNSKHEIRIFPAIDIFAFGIILLQMIAPKWYERHGRDLLQTKIDDAIHTESLLQSETECCVDDFASEVGECGDLIQLAKDCLMMNRKKRPENGAALVQRLTTVAARAADFDFVDEEESTSPDSTSSDSDSSDDEGGDQSTTSGTKEQMHGTRSNYHIDGFSNNMSTTASSKKQGSLHPQHQTLDDE